jgi:hypothetical protein
MEPTNIKKKIVLIRENEYIPLFFSTHNLQYFRNHKYLSVKFDTKYLRFGRYPTHLGLVNFCSVSYLFYSNSTVQILLFLV